MKSTFSREIFLVALVLGIGIIIIFWQVFALGYVQVPSDVLNWDPVMREAAPPDFTVAHNTLVADLIYQFYVWHTIAAREIRATGRIPLWDPYILAGEPLVANSQPGLFYPVNLLLFFTDPATVATLRDFFNILVAGIFTFLFCRELYVSFRSALLAGIAFAFSGAMMVGPGHAYASSLAWIGFIFWSGERLLNRPRWSASLVLSIGIGLTILGGHPETVLHNLLVASLYFSARTFFLPASSAWKARTGGFFLFSLALGLALAAIQWLPFAALLSNSSVVSRSRSFTPDSMFYSADWLANSAALVTLIYPNFFGNPADGTYFWPFNTLQNYLEQAMYFGLIPLACAAAAITSVSKKNLTTLILVLLAILCLLVALRVPGFEALNYLPGIDRTNNTRLKWTFSFIASVLAGIGMDELKDRLTVPLDRTRLLAGFAIPVMIGLGIAAVILLWKTGAITTGGSIADSVQRSLLSVFSLQQPRTVVSAFVLLLAALFIVSSLKRPTWALGMLDLLVFATFVELVVVDFNFNTTVSRDTLFPEVSIAKTLQQDHDTFRIIETPGLFGPNYPAVYGISMVGGYDLPTWKIYSDVYLAQGGQSYRQAWSADWPLVDWMNVKYVIGWNELKSDKYELVVSQRGYRLYRNKNVLPRAFLVHDWQAAGDAKAALATMTSGSFDFKSKVLLEQPLPPDEANSIDPLPGDASEKVRFLRYSNDSVIMHATAQLAGLLVMSDVIAPGWQVWVDDEPKELLRANYAFRAVFFPAGNHTVRMEYHPIEFTVGSWLSAIALGIIILGVPLTYWRSI